MRIVLLEVTPGDLNALGSSAAEVIAAISAFGDSGSCQEQPVAIDELPVPPTAASLRPPINFESNISDNALLLPFPDEPPPLLEPGPESELQHRLMPASSDAAHEPKDLALPHDSQALAVFQPEPVLPVGLEFPGLLGVDQLFRSVWIVGKKVCIVGAVGLALISAFLLIVYSFSEEVPPQNSESVSPEAEPETSGDNPSPENSETPSIPTFPAIGGGSNE